MIGLLHTKGYSRVIDMTGEEKNGRQGAVSPTRVLHLLSVPFQLPALALKTGSGHDAIPYQLLPPSR